MVILLILLLADAARPPKPDLARLTLEEGAALAAKAKLPLLVWVGGHYDPLLIAQLPKCVQIRVETYKGSADKGVVCAPLHGGGPLGLLSPAWPVARRLIPVSEASVDNMLRELSGAWLRVPVSAAPAFFAPRTANC